MERDIFSISAVAHAAHKPFFLTDSLLAQTQSSASAFSASPVWVTPTIPLEDSDPATGAAAVTSAIASAAVIPPFVLGGILPSEISGSASSIFSGLMTDDNTDQAVGGDAARAQYGVTGAGIKIGILSDSFNLGGGMAAAEADGNLPANVQILQDGPNGGHDEGQAMAEIVHSIAPGAQILFHTGTDGEANMAAGIAALQAAGCNIIVDDVAYLDEPFFQDGGLIQTAVENAVNAGVSYFTAAGNEGDDFVQQTFNAMQVVVPGLPPGAVVQNFGSAAAPQPWVNVVVPTGGQLELDMQWDQPFASIGTGHSSADSLGMALYNTAGQLVASATSNDTGGNPDQILSFENTTADTSYRLVVYANGGTTPPDMFKIINYGSGYLSGAEVGQGSGTVIGHQMVLGDNTVGAMAWASTPQFNGSDTPEPYSSEGSGDILYGSNGALLTTPETASKVNFLAPDGSITSVLAPFYGTSAAAPAAAAVAALMLQANPSLSPTLVTSILEASASPVGGSAASIGAGLIQADPAVGMAQALYRA